MRSTVRGCVLLLATAAIPAGAQQVADGAAVFARACATCHDGQVDKAPSVELMRQLTPESIVNSLTNGKMLVQGSTLSADEHRAVAQFITGRAAGTSAVVAANVCTASPSMADPSAGPSWNGWGNGVANTRFADRGGLTAADLPKLKLKWAFGYANVSQAYTQPSLAGGRLFVASANTEVHALDPRSGCAHWTFKAMAGVRTAISVARYSTAAGQTGYAAYFGDARSNVYAVDADTGQQIWVRKVHDHAAASITGALAVHGGRVFVPVQGLNEEGRGALGGYECCTFRGSISALDANTGSVIWTTYTVDEPKPREKNKDGVQMWGPAGGGIWAAPTVDPERGRVYVATGNGYANPLQPMTDAVVALDIETGSVRWVNQVTPNDIWTMGCQPRNPDNPACPEILGEDHDFSASPALVTVDGRELLVLPQKSGLAYALDPAKDGALVWQYRIGQGSAFGGQWGAAVDGENAYFGVADLVRESPGGIHAVRLATGERVWYVPPQPRLCDAAVRTCRAAQGGATTAIPGAVLSGAHDGGMRAYSTVDGAILWQYDTNRDFDTVNGVAARGGSIDAAGAIVAGGMLYFNSGYGGIVGTPGNVLLAFGID